MLYSAVAANSLEVNCFSLQSFVYLFIFVAPSNYFLAFLSMCSHRAGESLASEAGGQKPPVYPSLLYAALVADWLIKTVPPKFLHRWGSIFLNNKRVFFCMPRLTSNCKWPLITAVFPDWLYSDTKDRLRAHRCNRPYKCTSKKYLYEASGKYKPQPALHTHCDTLT